MKFIRKYLLVVFNVKDYPDFVNWLLDIKMNEEAKEEARKNNPELWVKLRLYPETQREMFPEYYKEWVRFIGGVKNVFLRELIDGKKKA
jgi:predicted secreted Zn-dependent protease